MTLPVWHRNALESLTGMLCPFLQWGRNGSLAPERDISLLLWGTCRPDGSQDPLRGCVKPPIHRKPWELSQWIGPM